MYSTRGKGGPPSHGGPCLGAETNYDMDHRYFHLGAELIEQGRLPVGEIVTHNERFSDAPDIYEMLRTRAHEAAAVLLRW